MVDTERYDLVIVGLGSAGMVAAQFACTLGLRVAAIERGRVGGDCLWTGCVPSKALLASAKAAHTMRHADHYGLEAVEPRIDTAEVWARIRRIQEGLAATDDNAERFAQTGVQVIFGDARLAGPTTLEVDGVGEIHTRHVLLCTGSRPAVPDVDGLAAAGFLTSETLWELERAPESVLTIGGGPIAVELAQALTRLGVPTTVLQRGPRILPRDEPALVDLLSERLRSEGVGLEQDVAVERVTLGDGVKCIHGAGGRRWRAAEILVGTGRMPNVEGLGLEQLGIGVNRRGVEVDASYRTAVRSVYAVGDLAGRHRFTHSAGYEAVRAVRNMFYPGRQAKAFVVPWTTFTDPELAHVGLTAEQARAEHGEDSVAVWSQDLAHSDRARADGAEHGAIVVITAKGRVVGGHALAPAAGELIHELVLAVHRQIKFTDLASVVHVYPTLAIGIQQLAGQAAYDGAARYRWLVR